MRFHRSLLLCLALSAAAQTPTTTSCCGPITPAGEHLARVLDSMDVEHHWQEGMKVYWNTGDPKGGSGHTHCSAFAAAAGQRLGVYLLRPPEHGQDLLASAQGRWFGSLEGYKAGWRPVMGSQEAQTLANEGQLVVLDFINPDHHRPGHIAIVRPAIKSQAALDKEGPQTTQAGLHNFTSGNAVRSFQAHPGAWPDHVLIFSHAVDYNDNEPPAPPVLAP